MGANNYGQLGIAKTCEQCNVPIEVFQTELQFDNIVSIVGGGGHTLVLDNKGSVYGCGLNNSFQLTEDYRETCKFQRLTCLEKYNVAQIACGWDCSFAVTKNGCVVVWGSNTFGQLGISTNKTTKVKSPVQLPISDFFVQVSCGLRHTALLTATGKVLVAGQRSKGQLGTVNESDCTPKTHCFREVAEASNVRLIACGQYHTMALTHDGKLLVWGDNKHGQLGCNPTLYPRVTSPIVLQSHFDMNQIVAIKCGWTHSVFLTGNGSVFNNGRNTYNQLGTLDGERKESWSMQQVSLNKVVKQLAVGTEHNLILSDNGELWSWGWNEHGNCGVGHESNVFEPTKVDLSSKAVLLGTGSAHSFILTET